MIKEELWRQRETITRFFSRYKGGLLFDSIVLAPVAYWAFMDECGCNNPSYEYEFYGMRLICGGGSIVYNIRNAAINFEFGEQWIHWEFKVTVPVKKPIQPESGYKDYVI